MGMTTKELIEFYEYCPFNVKGSVVNEHTLPALKKLDKIEQIMSKRPKDMISSNPTLRAINKVVEDGKDN